ncbi:hypothetical protein GCM10018793_41310 [Streptomyces sulfonofaciens]|uniref:Uncharacterized protein n=1 Tax=Streptomyces sulfonofaciens TaxID=68272 RepID=A0A919GCJ3_9ACTN|nr:hypothetical protein GCM10018793_41310 [Streptomyces sulfonofaciens]
MSTSSTPASSSKGTGGRRATRTAGRNLLLHMTPYGIRTRAEKEDWVSVITAMEARSWP